MSHKCGIKDETRSHKEKRWLSEVPGTRRICIPCLLLWTRLRCVALKLFWPGNLWAKSPVPLFPRAAAQGVKYGWLDSGFCFHGPFYWPLKLAWIISGSQKTLMHRTELWNGLVWVGLPLMTSSIVSSSSKKDETKPVDFDLTRWRKRPAQHCTRLWNYVTLGNTHTTRSQTDCALLEAPIDPPADAYLLHPPLWPAGSDSIQIDAQSCLVIRDTTRETFYSNEDVCDSEKEFTGLCFAVGW